MRLQKVLPAAQPREHTIRRESVSEGGGFGPSGWGRRWSWSSVPIEEAVFAPDFPKVAAGVAVPLDLREEALGARPIGTVTERDEILRA